jgi:hypothetical protein
MRPRPLAQPPGIDLRTHAVDSRSWGDEFTCYVVRYDGRWLTWTVRPHDDGIVVHERPDETAAREFMAAEMARLLVTTQWGDRVASVVAGDEISTRVLFSADVLDGGKDGIWLATCTADGDEDRYELAGFSSLNTAVAAFVASTDQAANAIAGQDVTWPELTAGYLRYSAAAARAGMIRAELGDLIRCRSDRIRAERAVTRVAATVGISREFFYRVLAGNEWTWKGMMPMRRNKPPVPREASTARNGTWAAAILLAVQATDERTARAVARDALGGLGVVLIGEPSARQAGGGLWAVTAELRLDGPGPFEPDDASTRLSYLTGLLPEGVPWVTRVEERGGTAEWPPSIWDRLPGAPDELLHPDIRGVRIWVSGASR